LHANLRASLADTDIDADSADPVSNAVSFSFGHVFADCDTHALFADTDIDAVGVTVWDPHEHPQPDDAIRHPDV
jgi:hypothetical protein